MACRIVIISKASPDAESLRAALATKGHDVVVVTPSELDSHRGSPHDIVLAAGADAVEICEKVLGLMPKGAVVVLDRKPDLRRAIAALRAGAADFVTDPDDSAAVDDAIRRVAEKRVLGERLSRLSAMPEAAESQSNLLGESVCIRQVISRIERLRGTDSTLLVTGESGTGKNTVARILHEQSPRRRGTFLSVNCASLRGASEENEFCESSARGADSNDGGGLLARAAGGTLFLDEIEKLSLPVQARLHRTIEQRAIHSFGDGAEVFSDVRIVAACNVELSDEVTAGRFRQELFVRLSVVQLRLPPLRERGLDTLLLAQHFVRRCATASGKRVVGMTLGAARMLMAHDWPGNVRELQSWVEAAVATARHDHITEDDSLSNWSGARQAPERSSSDDTLMSWNSLEARHIASILEEAGGNKARAARLLGIDRRTLYRKLERYGLDAPDRYRRAH